MADYQFIKYEERVEDGIGRITLNRPEVLNAFHLPMVKELRDAITRAGEDDNMIVLILRGAGRSFCVGRDFKFSGDLARDDPRGWNAWRRDFISAHYQLWRTNKITIAQAHGHAFGGGFVLAVGCDITIVAEGTKMGYPDTRFGTFLNHTPNFWVEMMGPKKAKEHMLTGHFLDAKEAYDTHLVNRVVPLNRLEEEVMVIARDVAVQGKKNPGQAETIKFQINRQFLSILTSMDPYTSAGYQIEREYVMKQPEIQGRYFGLAAEGGAKAMIAEMKRGMSRSGDPDDKVGRDTASGKEARDKSSRP